MASLMLSGAENTKLINSIVQSGLGSVSLNIQKKYFFKNNSVSCGNKYRTINLTPRCSVSSTRPSSQPRFIQHKKEAFWFYRFLSIVYDHIINPGHWTEDMRDEALEPADLYDRKMRVVDVGGGTGFTTLGIVKHVDAKNVTILDQSPHQLDKAKKTEALKECPFPLPSSCGSILRLLIAAVPIPETIELKASITKAVESAKCSSSELRSYDSKVTSTLSNNYNRETFRFTLSKVIVPIS